MNLHLGLRCTSRSSKAYTDGSSCRVGQVSTFARTVQTLRFAQPRACLASAGPYHLKSDSKEAGFQASLRRKRIGAAAMPAGTAQPLRHNPEDQAFRVESETDVSSSKDSCAIPEISVDNEEHPELSTIRVTTKDFPGQFRCTHGGHMHVGELSIV